MEHPHSPPPPTRPKSCSLCVKLSGLGFVAILLSGNPFNGQVKQKRACSGWRVVDSGSLIFFHRPGEVIVGKVLFGDQLVPVFLTRRTCTRSDVGLCATADVVPSRRLQPAQGQTGC